MHFRGGMIMGQKTQQCPNCRQIKSENDSNWRKMPTGETIPGVVMVFCHRLECHQARIMLEATESIRLKGTVSPTP